MTQPFIILDFTRTEDATLKRQQAELHIKWLTDHTPVRTLRYKPTLGWPKNKDGQHNKVALKISMIDPLR